MVCVCACVLQGIVYGTFGKLEHMPDPIQEAQVRQTKILYMAGQMSTCNANTLR
jgi:hypothetical protein